MLDLVLSLVCWIWNWTTTVFDAADNYLGVHCDAKGAVLSILLWVLTEPLRLLWLYVFWALWSRVMTCASFAYACVVTYVSVAEDKDGTAQTRGDWVWLLFKSLFKVPMHELKRHGIKEPGFGRLCYRWLGALHELWCVFTPDTLQSTWLASKGFFQGLWRATRDSWFRVTEFVSETVTASSCLLLCSAYLAALPYEVLLLPFRSVCKVMTALAVLAVVSRFSSWCCVVIGMVTVSKVSSAMLRCLLDMPGSMLTAPGEFLAEAAVRWEQTSEERAQRERLTLASYKFLGETPERRARPSSLSGIQAEERAARERRRKAKDERNRSFDHATARRGRRAEVGELCHGQNRSRARSHSRRRGDGSKEVAISKDGSGLRLGWA